MLNLDFDIVAAVIVLVGLVSWGVRLEVLSKQNREDIRRLYDKHDALEEKIFEKLTSIETNVANILGRLHKD